MATDEKLHTSFTNHNTIRLKKDNQKTLSSHFNIINVEKENLKTAEADINYKSKIEINRISKD